MGDRQESGIKSEHQATFHLGKFSIEPLDGSITGPAGRVHVDPKIMDVLVVLARRAREVVSRRELLEAAWPGRVVSDDALSRCVYQLRRSFCQAAGDDAYRRMLETIPKRGYRLNCDSSVKPGQKVSVPRVAGWLALIVVAAVAGLWIVTRDGTPDLPAIQSEAYDYFERGNDYYARPDHLVALPYAEKLYQQATELDPGFSSAWAALANTNTDIYWYGIDRSPVRLQKARFAVERLLALNPESPEARLVNARFLFKCLGRFEDALRELDLAEKSLQQDPELFFMRGLIYRRLGNWRAAIDSLDMAIALEPANVLFLRQQYVNFLFTREFNRAEQVLERILELFPDDGTAYVDKVVLALCRDGDTTLAHEYQQAAPSVFYDEGLAYTYTIWLVAIYDRDYARALSILDDSIEDPILDGDLRNASFGPKVLYYARTHQLAGDYEQAGEEFRQVERLVSEQMNGTETDDFRTATGQELALAEAHAALGQPVQALETVRHAQARVAASGDDLTGSAVQVAAVIRVLGPAGLSTEAIGELDNYLGKEAGHWSIEGIRADPRIEPLLNHPQFAALETKYSRR